MGIITEVEYAYGLITRLSILQKYGKFLFFVKLLFIAGPFMGLLLIYG
jgi:hypothetical protein